MFTNDDPPSSDDYRTTLTKLKGELSDAQLTIFQTQYAAPGRAVTSQELRSSLGYKGIAASNGAYGTLGKLLAGHINFSVSDRPENRPGWWRTLSTGDGAGDHFTWIMRPQLADALVSVGIVDASNSGLIDAPDVDLPALVSQVATEGRKQLVFHLRRERNRGLVKSKKAAASSLDCEICGFSSLRVYGIDYCEAHHLQPLSEYDSEAETTMDDLALVCGNCHRIVHSRFPPLSLDDVRSLIAKNAEQDAALKSQGVE